MLLYMCVLLLQVCLFLVVHSMHRMYEPVELAGSRTLEFGAVGLAINLCGVLMFGKRASRFTPFSRVSSSESAVIGAHQSNVQVRMSMYVCVLRAACVMCYMLCALCG